MNPSFMLMPHSFHLLAFLLSVSWAWVPPLVRPRQFALPLDNDVSSRSALVAFSSSSQAIDTDDIDADTNELVSGVTLKIAVDSQGGVADLAASKSDRFTSPASLDRVHRLRRTSQAILIGKGTVVFDNPSLTIRRNVPPPSKPPLRVVLDSRLSLLIDRVEDGRMFQLFEDGQPTIVYHAMNDVDEESLNLLESVTLVRVPLTQGTDLSAPRLNVVEIWNDLKSKRGVSHLMVEGGPQTARSFLQAGLIDRVILVKALGVTFREPIPSGITSDILQSANLQLVGTFDEEGDTTECWVRSGGSWPTDDLTAWP